MKGIFNVHEAQNSINNWPTIVHDHSPYVL